VHLSVIIATLDKMETARLLGSRVRSLLAGLDVETIVVAPGVSKAPENSDHLRYVADMGGGVYKAYTTGLHSAVGEFVWFMGDDDYPLDGAARIRDLVLNGDADVLVAPVLLSSGRIYRPTKSLLLLQYLNWCQQGVVYRRETLLRRRFFRRLKVQADQYVNVLLRADRTVKTKFLKDPICVFGVNGLSGSTHDAAYESLRTALAHRTLGSAGFVAYRVLGLLKPLARKIRRRRWALE
jgi:glycosyltransferase involved in cell wall biosynthesis